MSANHTSTKVLKGQGRAVALLLLVLITEHVATRVAALQNGRPSQQRPSQPALKKPSKQPSASSGSWQAVKGVKMRREAPLRVSVVGPGKGKSGAAAGASQVPSDGAWNIDQLLKTIEEDLKGGSFKADKEAEAESARATNKGANHTQEPNKPKNAADLHIKKEAGGKAEIDRQIGMPKKAKQSSSAASSQKAGDTKPKQASRNGAEDSQPAALRPRQDGSFTGFGDSMRPAGGSAARRAQPSELKLTTRMKKPPAHSRTAQPKWDTGTPYADTVRPEKKGAASDQSQDNVSKESNHAWKLPIWGKKEAQPAAKPGASSAGAAQDRAAAQRMRKDGASSGQPKDGVFEGPARAWDLALINGGGDINRNKLKFIVSQANGNEPDMQTAIGASDSLLARVDPGERYAVRAVVGALETYKAHSLLCVGCTQLGWLKEALELFTAADKGFRFFCVDTDGPSITRLKSAHGEQRQWSFYKMDPSKDQLPRADLLLSRDIGEGMGPREAVDLLENFVMSGATWLLLGSASLTQQAPSKAHSRPSKLYLSLQEAPFNLNEPLMVFSEGKKPGDSGDAPEKQLLLYSGSHLAAQNFQAMRSRAKGTTDKTSQW